MSHEPPIIPGNNFGDREPNQNPSPGKPPAAGDAFARKRPAAGGNPYGDPRAQLPTFSQSTVPGQSTQNQYGQRVSVPTNLPSYTPPNNKRLFLAIFGVLLTLMLAFGGLVAWVVYSFQASGEMTFEYSQSREPIGAQIPDSMQAQFREALPVVNEEIDDVRTFIDSFSDTDDSDLVDMNRFTREMQNSGYAKGVNSLTRLMWIENLRYSLTLPTLADNTEIIGFDWIDSNQTEARATVVTYWDSYEWPELWLLYLTKASGTWKLYDWREVLEPTSQSQYFALYTAAKPSVQNNYANMSLEVAELYYDDAVDWEDKPTRTLQKFKQYRYAESMIPDAQHFCATYLVLYESISELEQLTDRISDNAFIGSHYLKARLALLKDDKSTAFQQTREIVRRVGWHPVVGSLARQAAESDEEKRLAAEWLWRAALIMPTHDFTTRPAFELADEQQYPAMLAALLKHPNPADTLMQMLSTLDRVQAIETATGWLAIAEREPQLRGPVQFGELKKLAASNETDRTLSLAAEMLGNPAYSEQHASVWEALTSVALQPGNLAAAHGIAPDKAELLSRLSDALANNGYGFANWQPADWSSAEELLSAALQDASLSDQPNMRTALAVCKFESGEREAVLDLAWPIFQQRGSELLGDEIPQWGYRLFDIAAQAAIETKQTEAFIQAVAEPETAFVTLAFHLTPSENAAGLQELLDWYGKQEAPQLWRTYEASQLAYYQADWAQADQLMEEFEGEVAGDTRIENWELPAAVAYFCVETEELRSLRVEMAVRCRKLPELIEKLRQADALDDDWAFELDWQVDGFEEPAVTEPLGSWLAKNESFQLRQLGMHWLAEASLSRGDTAAAFGYYVNAARAHRREMADSDYGYYNYSFRELLQLIIASDSTSQLPRLRELANTNVERTQVELAEALLRGDGEGMVLAFEKFENEYSGSEWFYDPIFIEASQRAGTWATFNAAHPVNATTIGYNYEAGGLLLFSEPPSTLGSSVADAFARALSQEFTEADSSRFPDASAVWRSNGVADETGSWLLLAFDGVPHGVSQTSELGELLQNYAGSVCLMRTDKPIADRWQAEARAAAAKASESLEQATGYWAHEAGSLFAGEGFAQQLAAAINGVNPSAPVDDFLAWVKDATPALKRVTSAKGDTEFELRIDRGLVSELIPIRFEPNEFQPEQLASEGGTATITADSMLMPVLQAGTRVQIEANDYALEESKPEKPETEGAEQNTTANTPD